MKNKKKYIKRNPKKIGKRKYILEQIKQEEDKKDMDYTIKKNPIMNIKKKLI